MVDVNRRGLLVWPTRSKVVRFVPEQEIAFGVEENWTVWSYAPEDRSRRGALRRSGPGIITA
jgi:hypothetical protein